MSKSIPSEIKLTHILPECMSKSWRSVYHETRWRHYEIFSAYAWRFAGAEKRLTRSANYHLRTPTKIFRLIESLFDSFSYLCRLFENFHLGKYFFLSGGPWCPLLNTFQTRFHRQRYRWTDSVHSLSAFRLIDARENKIPIYFEPTINHSSSGLWREVWMVT